jgi:hypothetical protein
MIIGIDTCKEDATPSSVLHRLPMGSAPPPRIYLRGKRGRKKEGVGAGEVYL